ncbi:MAG: ATP-binding cassette domain-containing protein [Proteobacteria bacterium]|nr:ATP-binding cassette domain-containing protein [Pseudomonadota bacterium]MBU1584499.1 ATP-binding cassette domain-containing protein [Pseudomonadota bacterium]MBU2630996.1 ATP-binding cassette domain-containing protein [Pseudomonadota bacterium]
MNEDNIILSIKKVVKHFDISGGFLDQVRFKKGRICLEKVTVKALNDVSLFIKKGETLSVVGESGCGKSTLARVVLGLYPPNSGEIYYDGKRIDNLNHGQMLPFRKKMQMIFQDPYASLNPRKTVQQTLEEPLRFHHPELSGNQINDKIELVMDQVGVDPAWRKRYPHEFSGGQRQRISIARGLILDPEFIVADEPVSALDVSIQAQILNLLMKAGRERGLTYLFITHDLSVVRHISTRVAVMYLGTVCELAKAGDLFAFPRHPYTKALLSAIPIVGQTRPKHIKLKGEVPTPVHLPTGCVFHARCVYADDRCVAQVPELFTIKETGTRVACHGVEENRLPE